MAGRDAGSRSRRPEGEPGLRIEAARRERWLATAAQGLLSALVLALVGAGARVAGIFWPERTDPEVGVALWLFVGTVTVAALTLAWLIVLLQDLVKMTIVVTEEGLTVDRWLAPFHARWDEVREIGMVPERGQLTLLSARGSVTATARLLGGGPFATLASALRRHAGHAVQEWSVWAAARRQLLLLGGPAVGLALLLVIGQGLWRRRLPRLGRGGGRRR